MAQGREEGPDRSVPATRGGGEAVRSTARIGDPPRRYGDPSKVGANRGGIAVLAPVHEGTRSLVVRSGWGAIPRVIASLGGSVVGVERRSDEIEHAKRMADPTREAYVRIGSYLPLPFGDESFDTVFLADRSALYGSAGNGRRGAAGEREEMLREAFRVLRPGGTLVLESPNRLSFLNLIGKSDVGERGGIAEILPRRLARAMLRVGPNGPGTPLGQSMTNREYLRLLRRCGFREVTRYIPWPDRNEWYRLWPERHAQRSRLGFGDRRRDRIASSAFAALRQFGVQLEFVPDFIHVARKASSDASTPGTDSPMESVLRRVVGPATRFAVRSYGNSGSLVVVQGSRLFKIPLTADSRDRLGRELATLEELRAEGLADVAIRPAPFSRRPGLFVAEYPLGEIPPPAERGPLCESIVDRLAGAAKPVRLDDTDAWRRLFESDASRLSRFRGIGPLLDHLGASGDRSLPCGRIHGDLHLRNVVVVNRAAVAIDWDESDRCSPILVDAMEAQHSHAKQVILGLDTEPETYVQGIPLQFDDDPRLILRDRVADLRGELDHVTAVIFCVLVRLDARARGQRQPGERFVRNSERWIAVCREALRSPGSRAPGVQL